MAKRPTHTRDTLTPGMGLMRTTASVSIDRQSLVPLYAQLKEQILRLLAEHTKPSERFFTDSELIEMFGVSRITVRAAVRELVQEGHLYRVRGLGTFRSTPKVVGRLDQLQSFFRDWTAQGRSVSASVRVAKWTKCPEWAAEPLAVAEGSRILYIHRIRSADGIPIASDYRYLPEAIGRHVSVTLLRSKMILEILAERIPADPPASVRFSIGAAAAASQDARLLKIPNGAPVLVRTHLLVSRLNRPMSVGKSIYRADVTNWSIDLPVDGILTARATR